MSTISSLRSPAPYKIRREVNDGSGFQLTVTHLDTSDTETAPSLLRWRLDNLSRGANVVAWTTVSTPSTSNTITLSAANNTLASNIRRTETFQVLIEATISSIKTVDEYTYAVKSLLGVKT